MAKEFLQQLEAHFFWKHILKKTNLLENVGKKLNSKINFSVKLFYILLTFASFRLLMFDFNISFKNPLSDPLWPVFFVKYFPDFPWIPVILFCTTGSLFLAIINHKSRFFRVLVFLLFFILAALYSSNGKINHGYHLTLISLFCLIFLNLKKEKEDVSLRNTLIFISQLFLILSTYFIAGIFKIKVGFAQFLNGEESIFSAKVITYLLDYQFGYTKMPVLSSWLYNNYSIGLVLLWIGILIELTTIFMLLNSKLHKICGILLLTLHLGIAILLQVEFVTNFVVLVSFLVCSPFSFKGKEQRLGEA